MNFSRTRIFWLLALVCVLTLLPVLPLTPYHTKGEPRESVVSLSMLATDNWTLPRNNGGEMAYKPPFFHWCVAAVSAVQGRVSEASSRLPSALALIAMTLCGYAFYARRRNTSTALLATLLAFTAFELHRAGANCRVDMVLTALTVCALYGLFRWHERGMRGIPIVAILLMGLGTLTKGPVGSIIPCLVMGVYMLLRRENFFKTLGLLALWGLLSLVPYAAWFYAAWQQGGQEFLDLMYEENIGRMTSTMGYESCVEPWYYNFITLVAGWVPYTLLMLLSLFFLRYAKPAFEPRSWWQRLRNWVAEARAVDVFALTCVVVIFVFYCIPQSKRSVYLMPIYPFIAYFMARYVQWMADHRSRPLHLFNGILATLALLLPVCLVALKLGAVPDTMFHGRHAYKNILMMHALRDISAWWQWLVVVITTAAGIAWWVLRRKLNHGRLAVAAMLGLVFALYLSLDMVYTPAVLHAKGIKGEMAAIEAAAPAAEGTLYEYIEEGVKAKGDPVHFFEVNFYLGNRIESFHKQRPQEGFLLILAADFELNRERFEREGYVFEQRYAEPKRQMRVYRFHKK